MQRPGLPSAWSLGTTDKTSCERERGWRGGDTTLAGAASQLTCESLTPPIVAELVMGNFLGSKIAGPMFRTPYTKDGQWKPHLNLTLDR